MDNAHDSERRGEQILAQLEVIANNEAARIRQRLAADLVHLPIDRQAFDLAVDAYDDARDTVGLPSDGDLVALEAFLRSYLFEAGRS